MKQRVTGIDTEKRESYIVITYILSDVKEHILLSFFLPVKNLNLNDFISSRVDVISLYSTVHCLSYNSIISFHISIFSKNKFPDSH